MRKSACLLLLLALLAGCKHMGSMGKGVKGSGNRITQARELSAFTVIEPNGAYEIQIECQKAQRVEIEADDNILPLIETEARGGVLYIKSNKDMHTNHLPVVRISMPDLTRLNAMGASSVKIIGMKNERFELQSSGATKLNAAGETKSIDVTNTGAGLIDTSNLHSEKATVSLSGAGQVDVYATQNLDVNISGVGRVRYAGNPKSINKNISGIGTLSAKD